MNKAQDLMLAMRQYLASEMKSCGNRGRAENCYCKNNPYNGEYCDRCRLRKAADEAEHTLSK